MRLVLPAALAAALAITALPPHARAETLGDAIALAYRTNPALLAQRAALRALDENYVQARAALGPAATASVEGTSQDAWVDQQSFFGGITPRVHTEGETTTQDLSVTQPLYTGGQLHAQVDAARAQILAGRQTLRQAETQVLQNVITAYLGVLQDQEVLRLAEDNVALLTRERDDTEARFRAHEMTLTDLSLAQARLAGAESGLASARGRLAVTRSQYLQAVGQNPGELAPPPDVPGLPASVDAAFDTAERNNPALLAASFTEAASRAQIAQAKAANSATVSLRFEAGSLPLAPYQSNAYDRFVSATAVISKPIFASGLNASRVRQALEQNNRDRLELENTRRATVQSVAQAWDQLATLRAALSTEEAQVKAEEVAYAGIREELKVGLRSTLDVLNVEQELQASRVTLVQARHDEYLARVALLAAMGLLEARFLTPDVPRYSSEKAFRRVRSAWAAPWKGAVETLDSLGAPRVREGPLEDPARDIRPEDLPKMPPLPVVTADPGVGRD